jgi:superfamily II DNA/RNA helicase
MPSIPVAPHLKTALLMKLLGRTRTESVLVFTRTKYRAKSLDQKAGQGRLPFDLAAGQTCPRGDARRP